MAGQTGDKVSRTITVEEHFATPEFMEGPGRALRERVAAAAPPSHAASGGASLIEQLLDVGEGRIAGMDAAGIDVQVLSLTAPGVEQLEPAEAVALARRANDALAEAVRRYPDRLAGFASLPTPDPVAAADELGRAVSELGFKGAMINGHSRGRYLDHADFEPIFARAEALNVPIYLHPTPPPGPVIGISYMGNYPPEVGGILASAAWGWHIETAIHTLRIVLCGAFDRHPGLQLVIGHLGEALPFMMERLDTRLNPRLTKLQRPLRDYLTSNVHYSISGFNWEAQFANLLKEVGGGQILFSADYPYETMSGAREFLDRLPIGPAEREQIAHGSAERLLGL